MHDWYLDIPVSVNDTYGDPFIKEQVENTITKLQDLRQHKAPIAIFTKAPYDPAVLERLKDAADNKMAIPFYSLTGLNEGGFSFENRLKMIDGLEEVFNRPVVILTRPIIKGRNDHPDILRKIVDVAKSRSKMLVLGGLHDFHKNKKINSDIEEQLIQMCDQAEVKCFHKSSCCGAYLYGQSCWIHDIKDQPINLTIASQLGYEFTLEEGKIVLNSASTGDLNFLRILTRGHVVCHEIKSNYNLLSISTPQYQLECTSSWFAWSENIDTCIGCDYCIILQIEYLEKKKVKIGMNPRDLLANLSGRQNLEIFQQFKRTKLKRVDEPFKDYSQVRVVKPCFTKRYSELCKI